MRPPKLTHAGAWSLAATILAASGCDKNPPTPATAAESDPPVADKAEPTPAQQPDTAPTPSPEPAAMPEPTPAPAPPSEPMSVVPDLATLDEPIVVEGGTYETAPNLLVPEDWVTCRTEDDCVIIEAGCCDHCNGGAITAVNENFVEGVEAYLQRYGCEDAKGVCTKKTCDPPDNHEVVCMTRACIIVDVEKETHARMWGEPMGVPGGVPGGVVGGVVGGTLGGAPTKTTTSSSKSVDKPIAEVKKRGIYTPDPDRKKLAATKAGTFDKRPGKSKVSFCVGTRGKTVDVKTTKKFKGDPKVDEICRDTVKKWRFKPFIVGGKPIEVCTEIEFAIRFD